MTIPVAILAGGLATRIRPITETIPKAMISIAGEPFIAHQLRLLASQGFHDIVVCAGYLSEQIIHFVGDGQQFGVHVRYSTDWPELLGTGGALRKALPMLGDAFMVMYGDSYLKVDYPKIIQHFQSRQAPALMTLYHNQNAFDSSNVIWDGGEYVNVYSKTSKSPDMAYIDYGLGVIRSEILQEYPIGHPFDLAQLYEKLAFSRQLVAYLVTQRFYEIGSFAGIADLEAQLTDQRFFL